MKISITCSKYSVRAGVGILVLLLSSPCLALTIGDLSKVEGDRGNFLIGYGIVVGLPGTGDDTSVDLPRRALETMLRQLGSRVQTDRARLRNVAAVVVTAELPGYSGVGQRIDVNVSSIGNARSLTGGTLLATPLQGPDGEVYVLAQGRLVTGGYRIEGNNQSLVQRNLSTSAQVPTGGMIERMVPNPISTSIVKIYLRDPDFQVARQMLSQINGYLSEKVYGGKALTEENRATQVDAAQVMFPVPESFAEKPAELVADISALSMDAGTKPKVVVNERTGTVVLGGEIELSAVAVAHGGLNIQVFESQRISQPNGFSNGTTQRVQDSRVNAQEEEGAVKAIGPAGTLNNVVEALNALEVKPRDLIAILQALRSAGALNAEVIVQ